MSQSKSNAVGPPEADSLWARLPPYASALGLMSNPFPVTPDETHYFFTPALEAIYEEVAHFIEMRKGFVLLTGDVGLGKTTLLRRLLAWYDKEQYNTALVLTSFLDQTELLETIASDFGLTLPHDARRIDHLAALHEFMLAESAKGKINILFLDDAQALDEQALDVVRQLSNLETAQSKLIQVVLCGQPELVETLNQYSLRQVKSRIALHRQLQPLDLAQIRAYIRYRLASAGSADCIEISADGLQMLRECTGGFPRRIHHVMDRCLYALFACGGGPIDAALVRRAWDDLSWSVPSKAISLPVPIARLSRFKCGVFALTGFIFFCISAVIGYLLVEHYGITSKSSESFLQAITSPPAIVSMVDQLPERPVLDVASSLSEAFISAPINWADARALFPGLADLNWPKAVSNAELTQQLITNLRPTTWQLVAAKGVWASPCVERPMMAIRAEQGAIWYLSYIEIDWPVAPIALGYSNEIIRQLQNFFNDQGAQVQIEPDGIMGPRTITALARFQLSQGLEVTGQFSPATAYRLSCRLAKLTPSSRGR